MSRFTIMAPLGARLDAVEVTAAGGHLRIRAAGIPLPAESVDLVSLGEQVARDHPAPAPWKVAGDGAQVVDLPSGGQALVQGLDGTNGHHGLRVIRLAGPNAVVADAFAPEPVPAERLGEVAELISGVGAIAEDQAVRLDISTDELTAIAEFAGLERFPGLEAAPPLDDARRAAACQALAAHGVVTPGDDGDPVVEPVQAGVLGCAITPIMTIHADHATGETRERRLYHLAAGLAAEHAAGPLGTHRFTAFPPDQLIARLGRFAGMGGRPKVDTAAFTLPRTTFERLISAAARRELDEAAVAAAPQQAAVFVQALGTYLSSTLLRAVRRDGERVAGGTVSWVDAGPRGLWNVELADDAVRVTPSSPPEVLARLAALWA